MSFSITDNQIIANEFNNVFVSIGKKLVSDLSSNVNPLIYLNSVVNSIVTHTNRELIFLKIKIVIFLYVLLN